MSTEELKQAGLTESESKVYLALIDLGPSHAGLISRKTGMHRRNVYDTTEMLIKKGLIGYIVQNNRKLFQAVNPNRLLDILKEKQSIIEPTIKMLNEKFLFTKEKEETNFYKGKNGIQSVFEDQLEFDETEKDKTNKKGKNENKEICIIGAHPQASKVFKFYLKWYTQKRKARKIKMRIITSWRKMNSKSIPYSEVRYLPKKYESPVAINLYRDKTAIILWASNPLAIVIKNKEITEGYRKYFEILWKSSKKE